MGLIKSNEYAFTMVLKKHLDEVTDDRAVMLSNILLNKLNRLIRDANKSKLYNKSSLDLFIIDIEGIKEYVEQAKDEQCTVLLNSAIRTLTSLSKCHIQDNKGNNLKLLLIK